MTRKFMAILLMSGALFIAACGTIATPVYESETEDTEFTAEADAHSEEDTEEAVDVTAEVETPEEETETEAPTATTEPTAEPTIESTAEPTEAPTEEAAAENPIAVAIAAGDIANGQTVFNESYQTSSGVWMCASCHSVDESEVRLVGPAMYNLYQRVGERADAADEPDGATYTIHAITMPNAYIVEADPAYPENLMPQNYGAVLTEQELADVVAYILSLGNPDA